MKTLTALKVKVVSPLQEVGEGIKVGSIADPFGNVVGLIENPHFGKRINTERSEVVWYEKASMSGLWPPSHQPTISLSPGHRRRVGKFACAALGPAPSSIPLDTICAASTV